MDGHTIKHAQRDGFVEEGTYGHDLWRVKIDGDYVAMELANPSVVNKWVYSIRPCTGHCAAESGQSRSVEKVEGFAKRFHTHPVLTHENMPSKIGQKIGHKR